MIHAPDIPPSTRDLLAEIDAFQVAHPEVKDSAIGHAVNDGKFVGRLRGGGRVFPETAERVRAWMAAYVPKSKTSNRRQKPRKTG